MKNDNKSSIKLDDISKENPYEVPGLYFDNFPLKLKKRIDEGNEKITVYNLFSLIKPQLALAFSIIGFALISFITVKIVLKSNQQTTYTIAEIHETIYSDSFIMDEELLILAVQDEDYIEISKETDDKSYEEEIVDYLLEEDVDLELIIEEL